MEGVVGECLITGGRFHRQVKGQNWVLKPKEGLRRLEGRLGIG